MHKLPQYRLSITFHQQSIHLGLQNYPPPPPGNINLFKYSPMEPRYALSRCDFLHKEKYQTLLPCPRGNRNWTRRLRQIFENHYPVCSAHNMFLYAPFCSPGGICAFLRLGCRVNTFALNRFALFLLFACGCLLLFKSRWHWDITPGTWGKAHSKCKLQSSIIQACPWLDLLEPVTQWLPTSSCQWPLGPREEEPSHQLVRTQEKPKTQWVHSAWGGAAKKPLALRI